MKKAFLILFLLIASGVGVQAQKAKILLAKKVNFDGMSVNDEQKIDRKMKEEMDTFLGFGLKIGVDNVEETVKTDNQQKKKSAMRFQVGLQLPKFIKTDPPNKVFKVGWDFGVVK